MLVDVDASVVPVVTVLERLPLVVEPTAPVPVEPRVVP
jgi:hypothetical protein